MIDFKVLVKVARGYELDTLKTLGKEVEDCEECFLDVDNKWVEKQDFLTAVPVEIALTMEVRDAVMRQNDNCRYIVTGVPAERVKMLVERYGYRVVQTQIPPQVEEKAVEPVEEKQVAEDKRDVKQNYFINGKPVSMEEFNEKAQDVLNSFKKFYEEFWA